MKMRITANIIESVLFLMFRLEIVQFSYQQEDPIDHILVVLNHFGRQTQTTVLLRLNGTIIQKKQLVAQISLIRLVLSN